MRKVYSLALLTLLASTCTALAMDADLDELTGSPKPPMSSALEEETEELQITDAAAASPTKKGHRSTVSVPDLSVLLDGSDPAVPAVSAPPREDEEGSGSDLDSEDEEDDGSFDGSSSSGGALKIKYFTDDDKHKTAAERVFSQVVQPSLLPAFLEDLYKNGDPETEFLNDAAEKLYTLKTAYKLELADHIQGILNDPRLKPAAAAKAPTEGLDDVD